MFKHLSVAFVLVLMLWGNCAPIQASAYSVGNYQLISKTQISRTIYEFTYKATLTNPGATDVVSATAVVTSKVTTTAVQKGNLTFGAAPAGGSVVSSDTFTIRQDQTVLFDWNNLVWSIQVRAAPIANAGVNQWATCTSLVTLDGSGSTSSNGALTYAWSFVTKPAGSTAALSNPAAVKPTFTADKVGDYKLQLVVSDATPLTSAPGFVTISTDAVAPTANAGTGRTVTGGTLVQLDGSGSSDPTGLALTYAWSWMAKPSGSSATLTGPTTVHPGFTVDRAGDYVIKLIVNNGYYDSTPAQVTITTTNTAPVANAGVNQHVHVGNMVTLSATGSTDVNGDTLTYSWSFNNRPTGSAATLSDVHAVMPTFTADVFGDFVVQLVVSDGASNSAPATVTVTTDPLAPTANAGTNQNLKAGTLIHLNGSGSTSANNLPLTYAWSLTTKPAGSTASLSDGAIVNPTFTADRVGTYVAQLIVSDVLSSPASTVTITSNDVAPVANAGANQQVAVGAVVTLDGTGSTDVDGDALTYKWSLSTVPTGSTAALSNTTAPKPTFTVDLSGTYVAQLIVNDGFLESSPTTVTIATQNLPPTANAGTAQQVSVGAVVTLDGSASKDFNGLPLSYNWTLTTKPPQSSAALQNPTSIHPTFVADKGGSYVAQLTVSDSLNPAGSAPSPVGISTNNIAPVAQPGTNQNVQVGAVVHLDGSASTSTSGYALTYSWTLTSAPTGSAAAIVGATSSTPSFTADLAGTYIVQLIVNDSIQNSVPATVTIDAAQSQVITVNLGASSALTFATVSGTVHLSVPAGPAGITVALASDKPSAAGVPASVTVTNGTQDVAFTVTTGSGTGVANISGSSTAWADGSAPITVNARTGSIALFQPLIAAARSFSATVTLDAPAPTAGASLSVTSDNASAATASGPAIIAAGQTTGTFTVTGGATNGVANIGVSTAGYAITPAALTKTPAVITLGSGVAVAPGNNATLSVSLSQPAPGGGATVAFAASPGGIVNVPATVSIAPSATAPSPQPQVAGVTLGTAQVTATASGYAPDTQSVLVQTALTLSTVNLQVKTDNTADITVSSTSPAGASGLMVTVQIDDTTIATAPLAVQIPSGQSSATFQVTGVIAGSTTLRVSAPSATGASATVTISQAPALTFSGGSPNIGKDLQIQIAVSLGAAAPPGLIPVVVTSDDPTKVLLSANANGDGSAAGGSASISLPVSQGSTQSPAFFVQGLASSGTSTLTITMTGYAKLVITVTLTPSGIGLFTPGGWGGAFSVSSFANQNLTVYALRLNSNLVIVEGQNLRPGVAPLAVTVTSSNENIGTVSSPVNIAMNSSSTIVTFHGVSGGTTTVALTTPSGWSTPSTGSSAVGTVTAATITVPATLEIGKDLQLDVGGSGYVYLATGAPADVTMTVSSDTPDLFFSTNPAVLGAQSIDIPIPKNQRGNGLHWYAQALGDTGTAHVTVHVPGYTDATFPITLRKAGLALIYQSLYSRTFTVNTLSNLSFTVYAATVAADGALKSWMPLGPRLSPLTVSLTTTDATVGPAPASVQLTAGNNTASVTFLPAAAGSVTIGIAQPTGWIAPNASGGSPTSYATLDGTVTAPVISVGNTDLKVGLNLQMTDNFSLPVSVPAGSAITVTLASDDPNVVLSTSPTVAGAQTMQPITVNPGGSTIGNIYVQVLGPTTGPTATITATASKYYAPRTVNVTVVPSGFSISTGYCSGGNISSFATTTLSPDANLVVCSVAVNAAHVYLADQALRPGISQTVYLGSSDTTIGTVPASVTFAGGDQVLRPKFHPVGVPGSTLLSVTQPGGFVTPTWNNLPIDQITANVSAPGITAYPYSVGFNLSQFVGISLAAGVPSGGATATITSDNPDLLVYNSAATPQMGTTIQLSLASAATYFTLTYESLAASGTANVSISIPGFATKTVVITLLPSGFYFAGGSTYSLHPGGTSQVTVYSAALNPTTGLVYTTQPVRDGITSLSVGMISSQTTFATVSPLTLTFGPGDGAKSFVITGIALGNSVITLNQPLGCSTPGNYNALTVSVN